MPARCIDCHHATLRPQVWEGLQDVMRGWLRCLAGGELAQIGRYCSPYADRECASFSEIEDEQKARRRRQLDKIDRETAVRHL